MLSEETCALLGHPTTHAPLRYEPNALICDQSGQRFPIRNGIPFLFETTDAPKRHQFWQWVYDRIAFSYDAGVAIGWKLSLGGAPIVRQTYTHQIEIQPGDKVLETAIGTGANIRLLPPFAHYYGVDISWNMLQYCQRNLKKWDRKAQLVWADAQALPFQDAVFDVVFHMGGIQFFNAPDQGIREMIRVAKPGRKIWVIDEIASAAKTIARALQTPNPIPKHSNVIAILKQMVPPSMFDIQSTTLSEGELYCLSFRKPE